MFCYTDLSVIIIQSYYIHKIQFIYLKRLELPDLHLWFCLTYIWHILIARHIPRACILQIGEALNKNVTISEFRLQNPNGTNKFSSAFSECMDAECSCLNYPDDSVLTRVIQGDVNLVGVFSIRQGGCR